MSNYRTALKQNRDRLGFIDLDLDRQITEINKQIEILERSRQTLMETKAILDDYGRLMTMELAGK